MNVPLGLPEQVPAFFLQHRPHSIPATRSSPYGNTSEQHNDDPKGFEPMLISTARRSGLSTILALSLGCFLATGCGSSQDLVYAGYENAGMSPSDPPNVPSDIVEKLTDCAEQGASRLSGESSAVTFLVKATEEGEVRSATLQSSILHDPEIEACMAHALRGMTVPASVKERWATQRGSGGVVTPGSQSVAGNVIVLGGVLVELLPRSTIAVAR